MTAPWQDNLDVAFRAMQPEDRCFVTDAWFKCTRQRDGKHARHYCSAVKALLSDATTSIVVAYVSDDPSVIYGFAAGVPGTLHLVYVKQGVRRLGLGEALARLVLRADTIEGATITAQPKAHIAPAVARRKLRFHPLAPVWPVAANDQTKEVA